MSIESISLHQSIPISKLAFSSKKKKRKDTRINRLSKPLLTTCRGLKVESLPRYLRKSQLESCEKRKPRKAGTRCSRSLQTRCLLAANKSRKSHPRTWKTHGCQTPPHPQIADVDVKKISVEGVEKSPRIIDRGANNVSKNDRSGRRESLIRWWRCANTSELIGKARVTRSVQN